MLRSRPSTASPWSTTETWDGMHGRREDEGLPLSLQSRQRLALPKRSRLPGGTFGMILNRRYLLSSAKRWTPRFVPTSKPMTLCWGLNYSKSYPAGVPGGTRPGLLADVISIRSSPLPAVEWTIQWRGEKMDFSP